jgi:hypothetical protein
MNEVEFDEFFAKRWRWKESKRLSKQEFFTSMLTINFPLWGKMLAIAL